MFGLFSVGSPPGKFSADALDQSQEYMKHSIYFRVVSTLYLSQFQSVNKTTLNNAKLNKSAQMPNAIKMKWRSCLQFHDL